MSPPTSLSADGESARADFPRSGLLIAKTTANTVEEGRTTPPAFICMCTLLVCSVLLANQSGSGGSVYARRTAAAADINRHKHRCTLAHTLGLARV